MACNLLHWLSLFVIHLTINCTNGELEVTFRITAGTPAKPNAFPYMVGLMRRQVHYCGGSILTHTWVLTAAHCCFSRSKELPNEELSISIGSVFLPTSTQYPVARKVYHEGFNISSPYDNDIALFKSKTKFELGDFATKVNLAMTSETGDLYKNCTVAGWGFVKIKNMIVKNPTGRLHFVNIDTVPRSKCLNAYGKRYIASDVLCVAGTSGKGTCNADSGAPLVCNSKQVGILSFGGECTNTIPEVYTKVSHYIKWIKKYVEDNKT